MGFSEQLNQFAASLQLEDDDAIEEIAIVVAREAARRRGLGVPVAPIVQTVTPTKVVVQRDFLNVVGSPTGGYTEAEVTMDSDGGIRLYSAAGGGGGLSDGDYGDIVVSSSGTVMNFDSAVVTTAAKTVLDDTTVSAMLDTLGGTPATGTGAVVRATSPALVTPNIGTPSAGTLTSCTGLPISTGVSGLGTGVATFLATPSSANLRSAMTDESGSGALLFAGGAIGTPSSGTLTNCTGLPTAGLVDDAVTYAKLQNISATNKLLGRSSSGAGNAEEIACLAAARTFFELEPSDGDVLWYSGGLWKLVSDPGPPSSGANVFVLGIDGGAVGWVEVPLP